MRTQANTRELSTQQSYKQTYRQWVQGADPQTRQRLKELDLDQPEVDRTSYAREYRDELDHGEQASEQREPERTDRICMGMVLGRIRTSQNPLLMLDVFAYLLNIYELEGISQTELAQRHGVSRQAFSKQVIQVSKTFGLRPIKEMKSKQSRGSYRKAGVRQHTRRLTPKPVHGNQSTRSNLAKSPTSAATGASEQRKSEGSYR